jgi:ABC-2 type transport system permease protein
MTGAMFRAMWLNLINDRGALLMAFVMPVLFFLVMAEIFSSSSGAEMQMRVAFVDEVEDQLTVRLVDALKASDSIQVIDTTGVDRNGLSALVVKGTADIGVLVQEGGRQLDDVGGFGPAPLVLINDPSRAVSVPMLSGQIQQAYFAAMPDIALGSVVTLLEDQFVELDAEQQSDIAEGLNDMAMAAGEGRDVGWSLGAMIEPRAVAGQSAAANHVAYYAGAVAFMFLLFACMSSATSLTEERESGILDRILAGPGGMAVLVNGKFFFLICQGFVQMLMIFLTAWLVYDVNLPAHIIPWIVITLFACIAASGLALLVAAICRTPAQARNVSTIVVIILSVIGGSMVPRFFMPLWLRDLGWFTPNTWVLEAYSAVFWRDQGLADVTLHCGLLSLLGLVSLLAAQWLASQRAKL